MHLRCLHILSLYPTSNLADSLDRMTYVKPQKELDHSPVMSTSLQTTITLVSTRTTPSIHSSGSLKLVKTPRMLLSPSG